MNITVLLDQTPCNLVCTTVSEKPTTSILLCGGSRFPKPVVCIYAPHGITSRKTDIYTY